MSIARFFLPALLMLFSGVAHAQYVPIWLAIAAISPVFVLLLVIILGFAAKSWVVALTHSGLIVLWVLLFVIAAQTIENDYVLWTPIVLYAAHTLLIVTLIVVHALKRSRYG